ncbi:MAG TPA: hypothetical protein DDY37_04135, partial [Legionella sp.]|nr:hypothetical protein [Legionella sp.]
MAVLYLNNPLLTTERIIASFSHNLENLKSPKTNPQALSGLEQVQKKLLDIFFEPQQKLQKLSAQGLLRILPEVLLALPTDRRFDADPKLRAVLSIVLDLNASSNLDEALKKIESLQECDWMILPEKFNEYNDQYGYFNNESEYLKPLFMDLIRSCHSMIVFSEGNNTRDIMAYDYAYKLMALFLTDEVLTHDGPAYTSFYRSIYQLMNSIEGDKAHPLHDALLVKLHRLPLASTLDDINGWRNLVTQGGVKALPFWVEAQKIQGQMKKKNLDRAPKDLGEAQAMLMLCQYRRANEDASFAKLCYRYKVSEKTFNQCLNYMSSGWPKKSGDVIPDLLIEGQGPAEGLFWVKLPVGDKRALILGEITDCCQSIGGHSEECVQDAVSLPNNGLYVLVKRKKKGGAGDVNVILNDEINENDFKIIGQSYVWKSIIGNLCLDSLECLNGEITLEALRSILSDFGEKLLMQHPDIKCVTLGRGGKTPTDIFPVATIAEMMSQGIDYGDARRQYSISKAPVLLDSEIKKELKGLFPYTSDYAFDYLCTYIVPESNGFFAVLKDLFITGENASQSCSTLQSNRSGVEDVIASLIILHKIGLLREDFQVVMRYRDAIGRFAPLDVVFALHALQSSGLLSNDSAQANRAAVLGHKDPKNVASALIAL